MNEYECECDEINELMTPLPVRVDEWVRVIRWMGGCAGEVKQIKCTPGCHKLPVPAACTKKEKLKTPDMDGQKCYDHRTPCDGHLFV